MEILGRKNITPKKILGRKSTQSYNMLGRKSSMQSSYNKSNNSNLEKPVIPNLEKR
jgi:hypothetical protein